MVVAKTSKLALSKIRPTISGRRREVLNALKELEVASNEKLSEYLSWPINRVTGRVTELSVMGYVEVAYTGTNQTGHRAKFWRVSDKEDDPDVITVREDDRE